MNLGKYLIQNDKRYFTKVLTLILNAEKEQDNEYEKQVKKFQEEKPDPDFTGYTWEDYMSDLSYDHERTLQILYKSFVVSVVMFMEAKLLELCEHLRKEFKHQFSVYDLKHFGITRSVNYLKILGVDFPKNKEVKEAFSLAFRIRNNLVHADGKVNGKDEENKILGSKINQKYISFYYGEINFTKEYLQSLIDLNEKICDEISDCWLVKNFP